MVWGEIVFLCFIYIYIYIWDQVASVLRTNYGETGIVSIVSGDVL